MTKLKFAKIKNWKIYTIFASILIIGYKIYKAGKDSIINKLNQQQIKNNEKFEEIKDVIDNATTDERSKLL